MAVVERFGFPVAVVAALMFGGWRLLCWILKENSKREDSYRNIIGNHLTDLSDSNRQVAETLDQVSARSEEAHGFQRTEHKQMIETLIEINAKKEGGG